MAYFDYAAATPLDPRVLEAMIPFMAERFYNPSAMYSAARDISEQLEDARRRVARIVGVKQSEIIFTSGATEANNLAIQGVLSGNPGSKILYSATEHDSVRLVASHYDGESIPVHNDGTINCEALDQMIDDNVVLVSCMLVNNETGTLQPLRKAAHIIEKHRTTRGSKGLPLYLHCDAAQAPQYFSIDRSSIGADMISLNGSKMFGPKGSGCLVLSSSVRINPIVYGGGQERGMRSGTENVAGIIGFSHALEYAQLTRDSSYKKVSELQSVLVGALQTLGGVVHTAKEASPHIVSVAFPGHDNERLLYKLDEKQHYVATGSACHAKSNSASHVLTAMGVDPDLQMSTIRISISPLTSSDDIHQLVDAIEEFLNNSAK